jgi:hypothetical protein
MLSKNAKGTIAFLSVIALAHIWSAVTPVFKPPWEPWAPLVPIMKDLVVPFLVHIYRPVLIGFTGLAVFWIWDGRREGFLVALLLSIVASAFGVLVVIFNALAGEWSGLFTCVVSLAFPALMALWYSWKGYQEQ